MADEPMYVPDYTKPRRRRVRGRGMDYEFKLNPNYRPPASREVTEPPGTRYKLGLPKKKNGFYPLYDE